jgi:hypothetical protein
MPSPPFGGADTVLQVRRVVLGVLALPLAFFGVVFAFGAWGNPYLWITAIACGAAAVWCVSQALNPN